jgi:hypothetical protein
MMSLMSSLEQKLQNSNNSSISREASPPSSNHPAISRTTASTNGLEFQIKCCCDGLSESVSVARQPFCGWEQKSLPPFTGNTHIIFPQNSDQSLESTGNSRGNADRSTNGAFTKSKCSIYQSTNHKRTDFRYQIRLHIHSSDSKAILYEFEHHTDRDSDISLHIDKYRKSITYPKMEQKSLPLTSGGMAGCSANSASVGGEPSLWSPLGGRCTTSSSVLKPKLFVLGEGSTRPFTCRKVNDIN